MPEKTLVFIYRLSLTVNKYDALLRTHTHLIVLVVKPSSKVVLFISYMYSYADNFLRYVLERNHTGVHATGFQVATKKYMWGNQKVPTH